MRYMTRRDLAVVSATSIVLAVIGFGIYFCLNYTIVRANSSLDSNGPVAKQESPTSLQSNRPAVQKHWTAEKPKKVSDHVEQLKPQQEQPLVPAAPPVVISATVTPEVAQVPQATQPAGATRPEPATATGQSSPQSQVWSDTARNYPSTSYESPQGEPRERRGMTKNEKIVVGSAIAGGVITSILLSKRHR